MRNLRFGHRWVWRFRAFVCGIFTVVSHGGRGAHYAVYASLDQAGSNAIDAWINGQAGMVKERWDPIPNDPRWLVGCYVARVSSNWLSNNWFATLNANKAVAMWSICYSATGNPPQGEAAVKEAAGGRWRSGYIDPTNESEAMHVNSRFLTRMNGTADNGARRNAGEAWEGGNGYQWGFPPLMPVRLNVTMQGNDWTTLCPAPIKDGPVWPNTNPSNNRYGWGCIIFDTYMNDTISPGSALIHVTESLTYDHDWRGDTSYGKFVLSFDYDKTNGVGTTMKAVSANCKNKDPDGGRPMDQDRVAPSVGDPDGDDKEWSF